ncbi:MAG: glycosyltransferase [Candidatus Scalindua sp.]|nr:glycosyltransferase [Candidatus Scalindua sp.]
MRKINVLQFICPAGFYGAEMWILALAKNIDTHSINCKLAITRESEVQNIEVYNRFQSLGFDAYQINMRGRFDPRVIYKLLRLIKEKKIDIIHTHGYKSDILGLAAARLAGIKAIATPHGFENSKDMKLQLFIRFGCMALKRFDRVVPLSEELRTDMARIKIKPAKIKLIDNGVDLGEIEIERKIWSSQFLRNESEKKIVYIGQVASRKNVIDLIKTFDLLYKEHQDVRLIIIGDGPKRAELEIYARSLASSSKIEFLGYRDDRLTLLKGIDLFCMTSSLEGIPRCMMEAMAMGIPVTAFNIPGIDKLIIHEQTGLMADFGDTEGLKECWKRLLYDSEFAGELAQNARNHVINNYSAKRMSDQYMKLYQEVMLESV